MTKEPFIAHSELTNEIYVVVGKEKYCVTEQAIKAVAAIKALEQEPNTWSLDDAREDFMHDVYNTLDFLPTNNEANRIIDSFDRVTSGLKQELCEDVISRQELDNALYERFHEEDSPNNITDVHLGAVRNFVKNFPPATPQPKKRSGNMSGAGIEIVKSEETKENEIKYLNINVSNSEVERNPDIVRLRADAGILEYVKPKTGHWILTDVDGYRVWHCNCSECEKDPQNYIGGSENWWLIKNKLPKYCPNCGCAMKGELK